jgi:hypothetical protein
MERTLSQNEAKVILDLNLKISRQEQGSEGAGSAH